MAAQIESDLFNRSSEIEEDILENKYEKFFSAVTQRRKVNYLQEVGDLLNSLPAEKTYKFANGDMNPKLYPYTSISVDLIDGNRFTIEGDDIRNMFGAVDHRGYQPLRQFLRRFIDSMHGNQNWAQRDIILTCGSQDSMFKIFNMCLNDEDAIIVPVPLYSGIKSILHPMKVDFIQCIFDKYGPCIKFLDSTLQNRERLGQVMPKIMYVNPTGADPIGVNFSNQRRKELYDLACRYDFVIAEDDPYYYINFDETEKPISFLSMDKQNRVLRLDTFSKMFGMGFRVGFVTAPKPIADQLALYQEVSSFPSSIICVMLHHTLMAMGLNGFKQYLNDNKTFYRQNRDHLLVSLDKYMKDNAEWNVPQAAMFVWLKVKNLKHISPSFIEKCWQRLVILIPGFIFYMDDGIKCPYIRLGYSLLTPDRVDKGIQILNEIIKEEFDLASLH